MGLTILFLPTILKNRSEGKENLIISMSNTCCPRQQFTLTDTSVGGYTGTVNRGWKQLLERENWDAVCMLANDLYYGQNGWLERMREVLFSQKDIGMVGPSVKCGTHPQNTGKPGMEKGIETVARLGFAGALIKRATIEGVGLLDDAFTHYGSDFDFVHRAQEHGWRALWVRDVYCQHDWRPDKYPEWARQDRKTFYNRWDERGNRICS